MYILCMATKKIVNVRLSKYIAPQKYEITLRPDLEEFTFWGKETITLTITKATKVIELHSVDLEIESAELVVGKKDVWAAKITYDIKAERAIFTFPKMIPTGKGKLKITFRGILSEKLRGFYRSRYFVDGKEKYMAATQFEATDARKAFPCFDEPSQKAVFDVSLIIPSHLTAISNTMETVVPEHEPGFSLVQFSSTPKMSTYLLAFLVGEFEKIEGTTKNGVLVRVYVTPGKLAQAKFALEVGIKSLEFFEEYFAIKYPLPVMDLIAVPDFAAGAMENWGAVTFRETALLIDEEKSSAGNRQRVAIVIAHELAHMWFGDLVTMEWWTHLWLNEGFASYMEYLAVDSLYPDWDLWTQFVDQDMGVALSLDALKNTHPIEVEVHHPSEIGEIFDSVSYSKGSTVIRMLAEYIGAKDFRDGLRYYLKKHQYSNASTEDLWDAFEHSSGKPVRKIMRNWTAQPGYPVLTVEEKKNSLEVTQSRYLSSPLSKKTVRDTTLWNVPLLIKKENTKKIETYLLNKKSIKIPVKQGDGWIKLNSGESSFVRVDYPSGMLEQLGRAVAEAELEAVDRLGIVRDAFELAEAGLLSSSDSLRLVHNFKNEDNYTVWASIAGGLGDLSDLIWGEKYAELYDQFGREMFKGVAKKVGWKKKPSEGHTDSLLRSLVLLQLGKYGDKEIIAEAKNLFSQVIAGKKIDADLLGLVYILVAKNGGVIEYEELLKLYRATTMQQERDRLSRALASFTDKKLLSRTLTFALSKEVRSQDAIFVVYFVGHNPAGRTLAWEFIKNNWSTFRERYGGGHFLLGRLVESVGQFNKKEQAEDFEQFFKKNPTPEATRAIAQVLEKVKARALWLERDKYAIGEFLKD